MLFLRTMQQLQQESFANLQRMQKALELKAGVVEGTLYDVDALNELAKIPSREELISKLLGSLQSPITNLARVLNQIAEKVEQMLVKQLRQQKKLQRHQQLNKADGSIIFYFKKKKKKNGGN